MQVSATLIAAQQAAREAQARFQAAHVVPTKAGFSAALEKTAGEGNFSSLPLKQTAAPAAQPAATPQPNARLGTMIDIKV